MFRSNPRPPPKTRIWRHAPHGLARPLWLRNTRRGSELGGIVTPTAREPIHVFAQPSFLTAAKKWRENQASNLEPLVLETSARPIELHSLDWSRPTVLPRVFLLHKQVSWLIDEVGRKRSLVTVSNRPVRRYEQQTLPRGRAIGSGGRNRTSICALKTRRHATERPHRNGAPCEN